MEVDGNVIIKFSNGLIFKSLAGVYMPGTAGAYLINGNARTTDAAWEIKNVVVAKF